MGFDRTVNVPIGDSWGVFRVDPGEWSPPNASYPTGGYAPPDAISGALFGVFITGYDTSAAAHIWEYDFQTSKLKAYVKATGAEVANTTDLSAHRVRMVVLAH